MWWKKKKGDDSLKIIIDHLQALEIDFESYADDINSLFKRLSDIEGKINKLLNRRVRFKKGKTNAVAKNLSNL